MRIPSNQNWYYRLYLKVKPSQRDAWMLPRPDYPRAHTVGSMTRSVLGSLSKLGNGEILISTMYEVCTDIMEATTKRFLRRSATPSLAYLGGTIVARIGCLLTSYTQTITLLVSFLSI